MARIKVEYFFPLIVVLFFGLLIGCLEFGIRILKPNLIFKSQSDEFDVFCIFDSRLGRWHRKNFSHDFRGTRVTHNKKGIRGREIPYERNNNRKRVLILGDSVTWGYRASDGETFCDLLGSRFVNTDVINMSVSGYGTGEELLLLKHEGIRYHPDVVVLFFYIGNDVINNLEPNSFRTHPANVFYLEHGALKISPFQIKLSQRIGIWLNENSYIINLIRKIAEKASPEVARHKNSPEPGVETENVNEWVWQLNSRHAESLRIDYTPYQNLTYLEMSEDVPARYFDDDTKGPMLSSIPKHYYGVELTKKLILAIRELTEENKAQFMVVLSPFKAQLDTTDHYFQNPLNKELLRFLKDADIDAVDLLPIFADKKLDEDIYLPGDDQAHFSVKGHQEVADILYDELIARYGDRPLNEDSK